jgi:hypothetical protein
MSADRKAKKKKEEERDRRQRAEWVETYKRIVPLLGAEVLFQRLPEATREDIRRMRFPSPDISFGDDFNRADERENVREAVTRAFDRFTFKTKDGHEISARACFRVVFSLREAINQLSLDPPNDSLSQLITESRATLTEFCSDIANRQINYMLIDIDKALANFTRIDTAIYWYRLKYERIGLGRKGLLRITLHKSLSQRIRIVRNGELRPAFRCGAPYGARGIHWIDLPASLLGVNDTRSYPLYVQSHAIRNLYERVPLGDGGYVHDAMWQSFSSPRVTRNNKGDYLLEYWLLHKKIGYFVVELTDQSFLATTFLFLTMDGTPEAGLLYKQLHLKRPDIQQLGTDRLKVTHLGAI